MKISLFHKIFFSIMLLFILMSIITLGLFIRQQTKTVERNLIETYKHHAWIASINIESGYMLGHWPFATLRKLRQAEDVVYWRLIKEDGEIVLADSPEMWGKKISDPALTTEKMLIKDEVFPPTEEKIKVVVNPLNIVENGRWTFWLGFSLRAISGERRRIIFTNLLIYSIAITSIGFLSLYLTRNITSPIKILVQGTKAISNGNFDYRIPLDTKDEIGDLAISFNKMTENLQETTVSRNSLLDEIAERKRTEEALEVAYTKLKETQAELIQSAKMATVGQLGAGVAHEINNPLTGILGYAQFILQKLSYSDFTPSDFKKTCKQYVEYIEKESKRCKQIVENLLSFSRKPTAKFESLNIKQLMESTFSLIRDQLELENIKITTDYEQVLPSISGNANQLQQAFLNIIVNAQQAMPEGGELNICVRKTQDAKNLEISFKDTGVGIPKENLEKIFEPFFTTRQDWRSVGLGLSITYQIIQEHKGEISVASEVNKGTTFTILLPC